MSAVYVKLLYSSFYFEHNDPLKRNLRVGDGFAEGFGDALFRSPGISKRLQERLSANPSIKQSCVLDIVTYFLWY